VPRPRNCSPRSQRQRKTIGILDLRHPLFFLSLPIVSRLSLRPRSLLFFIVSTTNNHARFTHSRYPIPKYVFPEKYYPNQLTLSTALEVTTDAPQPPSLNIVSPTPRAFTFPTTHNLSDSPYSSPCNSPFEPDLLSLSSQCTPSSSSTSPSESFSSSTIPVMRTFTPDSPASPLNKRRKSSSCSSDVVERRPKKGDEDYIKRPENAFILFRRQCCEDRQKAQDEAAALEGPAKKQRQADLSKTISQQWKSLSADERKFWENLAKAKKAEHEIAYPNYVYRPQRAKDKDGRNKLNKKGGKSMDMDESKLHASEGSSLQYVVPLPRNHGRSASAPTPPPYQSIQLPNVYMTPSCPTSPSLLPMISRRAAHPGHHENPMSSFDYLPSSTYLPPSYAMQGQFEASLQVRSSITFSRVLQSDVGS